MAHPADIMARFEALSRPRFILGGHGTWHHADGLVTVPKGMRICFYVRHGIALCNPPSFDIDRGEFNEEGIIIGRQGGYQLIPPVRVYEEGEDVANYTLSTRNFLAVPEARTRIVQGGAVVGKKRFDVRFGSNKTDGRFITGDMTLAQVFADPKFRGAELHWSACRIEIP